MTPNRLIDIWQSQSVDGFGIGNNPGAYYTTQEEAHKACVGYNALTKPDPIPRKAVVMDDGSIWVLEAKDTAVYTSKEELEKSIARAKLTKRERKLLGL